MPLSRVLRIDVAELRPYCISSKFGLNLLKYTPLSELGRVLDKAGISRMYVDQTAKHALELPGGELSVKIARELKEGRGLHETLQSYLYPHDLEAVLRVKKDEVELVIVGGAENLGKITDVGQGMVSPPNLLRGLPMSNGIAIAKAMVLTDKSFDLDAYDPKSITMLPEKDEISLINQAIDEVAKKFNVAGLFKEIIDSTGTDVGTVLGKDAVGIIELVLDNLLPSFREKFVKNIESGLNPVEAARNIYNRLRPLERSDDEKMRDDALLVRQLLNDILAGRYGVQVSGVRDVLAGKQPIIIVGHDFTVAEGAEIAARGKGKIVGIVTEEGGAKTHIGMISKGIGVPLIGSIKEATRNIRDGDELLIDGLRGIVYVNPTVEQMKSYGTKIKCFGVTMGLLTKESNKQSITMDGKHIVISGNVESPVEAREVVSSGANGGIGLIRTEIQLTLDSRGNLRRNEPSIDEQAEDLIDILRIAKGLPVTARTVDIAPDKYLPYLEPPFRVDLFSPHPVGTALVLDEEKHLPYHMLFRRQLKAMLIAANHGNLNVMLPMVLGIKEIIQVRKIISELKVELKKSGIEHKEFPLGIMVENTSIIRGLMKAEEAGWKGILKGKPDFLSIGTNDLTQWVLGVSRYHTDASGEFDELHPRVLTQIRNTIDIGKKMNIPVCLCGDMASDPLAIIPLLGMGLEHFSMAAGAITLGKHIIRKVTLAESEKISNEIHEITTPQEIRKHIMARMKALVHSGTWGIHPNILDFITGAKA